MAWRVLRAVVVGAGAAWGFTCALFAGGGELAGSAFLKTLPIHDPPFGARKQEAYPWDGVRVQRWRREGPEADWVVVWIDLRTPGLGYWATPIHRAEAPGGQIRQAVRAQDTVDFLRQYDRAPRVDLAVNTVAFYFMPTLPGSRVFLSEPLWTAQDNERQPAPGSVMLGLLPGRALIGDPQTVRAARPVYAFGSFLDAGVIPRGVAVEGGRAAAFADDRPHGRTLAGVGMEGRVLILLVADGYNPGVSVGLRLGDAAKVLEAAGADQAIFLDGGGSATLVGRGDDGLPVLFNRPAGLLSTPGTLRAVAVNLGFTNLRRGTEPIPAVTDWEASWLTVFWARTGTWIRIHPIASAALLALVLILLATATWRFRRGWKRASAAVPKA